MGNRHLKEGTLLDERYLIQGVLGEGGFGITYAAENRRISLKVAVKELFWREHVRREAGESQTVSVISEEEKPDYETLKEKFLREARLLRDFEREPGVVRVLDYFEANNTAYLVMEYLSGISIGREMRLREYKSYSAAELSEIINPVMDALEAMHDQRIVHSDISPGNIMRTSNGDICLIDMGAAKYTHTSRPVLSAAFLKVNYAAPEQYRSARQGIPYDEGPWTDIYALGATIYYLLTGQKPPDIIKRLEGKTTKLCLPKKPRVKRARQWQTFLGHAMEPEIKERIGSIRQFREESKGLLN